MLTRFLNNNSFLKGMNYLKPNYLRSGSDWLNRTSSYQSSTTSRCEHKNFSLFSNPSMTDKEQRGRSSKSPDELKNELIDLIQRAQAIVIEFMNPELQKELREKNTKVMEKHLSEAATEFQKCLKKIQEIQLQGIVMNANDSNLAKTTVDIEKLMKNLEDDLKKLSDPEVAKKFLLMFGPPFPEGMIDTSNCKEIGKEQFEEGRKKRWGKAYFMRKTFSRDIECKLDKKTGVEECYPVEEEKTMYYECELPTSGGNKPKS